MKPWLLLLLSLVPSAAFGQKELLTKQDFLDAFEGVWSVNNKDADKTIKSHRFGYSHATHERLEDGTYWLKGHAQDVTGLAHVTPPVPRKTTDIADMPLATNVSWRSLPDPGNRPASSGTDNYGLVSIAKGTVVTYKAYYAVTSTDYPSQSMWLADDTTTPCFALTGPGKGLHDYHHGKVAGYAARPPEGMQADYLTGLCGSPGLSNGTGGPSLYAVTFDPKQQPGTKQQARILLKYGLDDATKMPGWDPILTVRGCAWIETASKHAVIFTGRISKGAVWYGAPDSSTGAFPTAGVRYVDKWEQGKGYHAENYEQGFWIYNPDDLRAVLSGAKKPHQPRPVTWIPLADFGCMQASGSNPWNWVTCSYRDGHLTIGQSGGFRSSPTTEPVPLMLSFKF